MNNKTWVDEVKTKAKIEKAYKRKRFALLLFALAIFAALLFVFFTISDAYAQRIRVDGPAVVRVLDSAGPPVDGCATIGDVTVDSDAAPWIAVTNACPGTWSALASVTSLEALSDTVDTLTTNLDTLSGEVDALTAIAFVTAGDGLVDDGTTVRVGCSTGLTCSPGSVVVDQTVFTTAADYISTSNGQGSALIGIDDAGEYFSGDTVESALQALGSVTNLPYWENPIFACVFDGSNNPDVGAENFGVVADQGPKTFRTILGDAANEDGDCGYCGYPPTGATTLYSVEIAYYVQDSSNSVTIKVVGADGVVCHTGSAGTATSATVTTVTTGIDDCVVTAGEQLCVYGTVDVDNAERVYIGPTRARFNR